MSLDFKALQHIGPGTNPCGVHVRQNNVAIFFLDDGYMTMTIAPTPFGNWDNLEFSIPELISLNADIEYLSIAYLSRSGIWATWLTGSIEHRIALFNLYNSDLDFMNGFLIGMASTYRKL